MQAFSRFYQADFARPPNAGRARNLVSCTAVGTIILPRHVFYFTHSGG
jgi:hypothetical protein